MDSLHPPERIIPEETPSGPLASHLVRYHYAAHLCVGVDVLDIACGVGYGSALLAKKAKSVVGADVAEDAVAYARGRYVSPNAQFALVDAHSIPFRDASFDAIVSFETLEHLTEPERFLGEVSRVLRDGGVAILSTPHAARTRVRPPENPYHVIEYGRSHLERLLRSRFATVEIRGQRRRRSTMHKVFQRLDFLKLRTRLPRGVAHAAARATGTTPWEFTDISHFTIDEEHLEEATEIIAFCRRPVRGHPRD